MEYTKGEWSAEETGDWVSVGSGSQVVAICRKSSWDLSMKEAKANAQLIASAPDMHKEIKTTIEELTFYLGEWASVNELYSPEWTHLIKRRIFHLEQALAKAGGK